MDDKTEFNEEWPEYDRFDDSANDEASIDDIRWDLINDHLARTGSPLKGGDKDTLVRTMVHIRKDQTRQRRTPDVQR